MVTSFPYLEHTTPRHSKAGHSRHESKREDEGSRDVRSSAGGQKNKPRSMQPPLSTKGQLPAGFLLGKSEAGTLGCLLQGGLSAGGPSVPP